MLRLDEDNLERSFFFRWMSMILNLKAQRSNCTAKLKDLPFFFKFKIPRVHCQNCIFPPKKLLLPKGQHGLHLRCLHKTVFVYTTFSVHIVTLMLEELTWDEINLFFDLSAELFYQADGKHQLVIIWLELTAE